MTAWCVSWKDSNGRHETSYSGKNAVLNHVEYCLNHGMPVTGIHTVWGEGQRKQCIFPAKKRRTGGKDLDEDILEALGKNGAMTILDIARSQKVSCRTDPKRLEEIRSRIYKLRDQGLVERAPHRIDVAWRLKE